MAATPKRRQVPSLAPPREAATPSRRAGRIERRTHGDALGAILADPKASGEGTRIITLAATRKGKTAFNRKLVRSLLDWAVAERALIHDLKFPGRAQYIGVTVESAEHLRASFALHRSLVAIQHPEEPSQITAEELATLAREATDAGIKTLCVFDEGDFALKKNDEGEPIERVWQGPNLAWLQLQGGAAGASTLCSFQMLRKAPSSCVDSACVFVVGCLGGRSLAYVRDLRIIPPEALETVTTLAPGEFCLFFADREWDHAVYYSPEEPREP